MTLVATVLLTVLAATITIIIVRQTVLLSRSESNRADVGTIQASQDRIVAQFDRELAADPDFYLSRTFAYERPRLCGASEPTDIASKYLVPRRDDKGQLVSQDWPVVCTSVWSYPPLVADATIDDGFTTVGSEFYAPRSWSAAENPVRSEIRPPTPDDPNLVFRLMTTNGKTEVGVEVIYTRTAASTWTLWSSKSLDVGQVVTAGTLGPSAFVYSVGRITLPTGQTSLTASVFAGEKGVSGLPMSSGARLLTGDPTQLGIPGFLNIRSVVPVPLTLEELRSGTSDTIRAACPLTDLQALPSPANPVAPPTNVPLNQNSSQLLAQYICLTPGASMVDSAGASHAVPSTATAWMLIFNPAVDATPATISVYYTEKDLQFVKDCVVACDLSAVSDALNSTGANPAVPPTSPDSPWQLLGQSLYPATGILVTGKDTFISQAGTDSVADGSVTVLAGSPTAPADIYINGSLSTSASALVGLVATRDVRFPYFATDGLGAVDVTAAIMALGYGSGTDATYGVPVRRIPDTPSSLNVKVTGSLISAGVSDVASAASFSLVPDPRLRKLSPPMFPSFGNEWKSASTVVLSSSDICPTLLAGSVTGTSTCLGAW